MRSAVFYIRQSNKIYQSASRNKTGEACLVIDLEAKPIVVDIVSCHPVAASNTSEAQFPVVLAVLLVSGQCSGVLRRHFRFVYANIQSELVSTVADFRLLNGSLVACNL